MIMWSETRQFKALIEFTDMGSGKRLMIDFHSIHVLSEIDGGVTILTSWGDYDVSQTMDEVLERIAKVTDPRRVER